MNIYTLASYSSSNNSNYNNSKKRKITMQKLIICPIYRKEMLEMHDSDNLICFF
jgi:hypothetical protein